MPFVKIDLFEGRSQEQKNELAREVTEVVSRIAKAPKENIHVFINDMPEGTYYPQGELKKKIRNSKRGYPGNLF
ncbi:TPA: 4-oxalocrotonate tautomerase [Streptococcus agalactiae]